MQQMWEGRKPKWQPANITREQIGLIAIYHIERRGHEMLAEFEIVEWHGETKTDEAVFLWTEGPAPRRC